MSSPSDHQPGSWQAQVSARVAAIRVHRGMSLSALARRAGVSKATLSGIESGRGNPTLDTIERLAIALAIPVSDLLVRSERRTVVRRAPAQSVDGLDSCVIPLPQGESIAEDILLRLPGARTFEFWRLRMEPGAAFDGVHHVPGMAELILIIDGSMAAGPNDDQHELGPGDLIEFAGDCAHSYLAGPGGCHALVALGAMPDSGAPGTMPDSGAPRAMPAPAGHAAAWAQEDLQ